MTETKDFPTAAIATLSSGISLCSMTEIHQAAEHLMGHPIWTHHFASKDLWKKMQDRVLAQHPEMPTSLPGVTKDNYKSKVAELEKKFGCTVAIIKGDGTTAMQPLEGIPENKPVIAIMR